LDTTGTLTRVGALAHTPAENRAQMGAGQSILQVDLLFCSVFKFGQVCEATLFSVQSIDVFCSVLRACLADRFWKEQSRAHCLSACAVIPCAALYVSNGSYKLCRIIGPGDAGMRLFDRDGFAAGAVRQQPTHEAVQRHYGTRIGWPKRNTC
jgi:hypothetical protein